MGKFGHEYENTPYLPPPHVGRWKVFDQRGSMVFDVYLADSTNFYRFIHILSDKTQLSFYVPLGDTMDQHRMVHEVEEQASVFFDALYGEIECAYTKPLNLIDSIGGKQIEEIPICYCPEHEPMYNQKQPFGTDNGGDVLQFLRLYFPAIDKKVKHPITKDFEVLSAVVIDLNDQFGWTREKIADWLESLDVDIRIREVQNANTNR